MARTNIDIDEEACAAVMQRFGFTTKREAVNHALRALAREIEPMSVEEARAMWGTGFDLDLEEIRGGWRAPDL